MPSQGGIQFTNEKHIVHEFALNTGQVNVLLSFGWKVPEGFSKAYCGCTDALTMRNYMKLIIKWIILAPDYVLHIVKKGDV